MSGAKFPGVDQKQLDQRLSEVFGQFNEAQNIIIKGKAGMAFSTRSKAIEAYQDLNANDQSYIEDVQFLIYDEGLFNGYYKFTSSSSNNITFVKKSTEEEVSILQEKIKSDDETTHKFTDGVGNVITKMDAEGTKSKAYHVFDSNGDFIGKIDKEFFELLQFAEDSGVYRFSDENGNVIAKIDSQGIHSKYFRDENGNVITSGGVNGLSTVFKDTEYYVLGDSLSDPNKWQAKLTELSGAIYSNSKNINPNFPLSVGGTATIGKNGMQERAINLVENYADPKIIILENINDYNYVWNAGSITDEPYMISDVYTSTGIYDDSTDAQNNIINEVSSVALVDRKPGAAINMRYYASLVKRLTINTAPTSDGTITLTVGGTPYSLEVTTADSIEDIVDRIVANNYAEYTDTKNGTNAVDFDTDGEILLSFDDTDSTGVSATITDVSGSVVSSRYHFYSKDVSQWETASSWVGIYGPKLRALYAGLLEYLQKNTNAKIYWLIPTRYNIYYDDQNPNYDATLYNADGSFNFPEYRTKTAYTQYQDLIAIQKEMAALYNVEVIDISSTGSITPMNFQDYYFEGNVHPKDSGYEKWGEDFYKLIKK